MKIFGIERLNNFGIHSTIMGQMTLRFFSLPIIQRIRYKRGSMGGGQELTIVSAVVIKICGLKISSRMETISLATLYVDDMMRDSVVDILQRNNAKEKLESLCRGLDNASKQCVYRICGRLLQAKNDNDNFCMNLTQEELQGLAKLHTEFYPNVINPLPNIYSYNGYFFPTNHISEHVLLNKHDMHLIENLDKLRQKDIIDVGGYIGDSAIVLQDFTDKSVHTFEATQTNYKLLLQTLQLNNATKIIPVNKGLGSKDEMLQIAVDGGCSSVITSTPQAQNLAIIEQTHIITLDGYTKENNIEVGFIKVDIEGFEMEFLKGAKETIARDKPAMLISIYHQGSDFFDIKPLIESWNLGYKFKIHKPIDHSIIAETALYCEVR